MGESFTKVAPHEVGNPAPKEGDAAVEREEKCVPSGRSLQASPVCSNCGLRHGADLPRWPEAAGDLCQAGREQGWAESAFCIITLGLACGWFYIICTIEVALLLHAAYFRSVVTGTTAVILLSSMWWPLHNRYPWDAFAQCYLFRAWKRYFQFEAVIEEKLQPGRRFILAEYPHGIMPIAQLLSATVARTVFPGVGPMAGVGADIVLRIPVIRQLYGWLGTRAAGAGTISAMFEDGVHVAVVVGGIAEMFLVSDDEERVYLRERKGFVRLAIKQGADIVPLFLFGQSRIFSLLSTRWLEALSRRVKCSLLVFYGRWGLTIPYRRPIRMVSGSPIRVEQSDDPSPEYVDALHAELIRRTEDLYARHRPEWEKRPLVVY